MNLTAFRTVGGASPRCGGCAGWAAVGYGSYDINAPYAGHPSARAAAGGAPDLWLAITDDSMCQATPIPARSGEWAADRFFPHEVGVCESAAAAPPSAKENSDRFFL
jgi:hypothetical protein